MTLTAHEHPLKKIFSSDFDFEIPHYQRPYAWEPEQALQLLADLEEAVERGGDDPYFLGSLVLIKEGEDTALAQVVDGQQRLTTLTILFAILRELDSGENAGTLAAMVMEPGIALDKVPAKPRLRLRKQDAAFFATYVQTPGGLPTLLRLPDHELENDSQKLIRDNAAALHDVLASRTQDERDAIAGLARTNTFLVAVTTPNIGSAHRIFSVLNDRGLDLAPSDILKSEIVGAIHEPAAAGYAAKWEGVEQSLGRERFGDLFLHIRTVVARKRLTTSLLTAFRADVIAGSLATSPEQFVDEVLLPYATAYEHVLDRDFDAQDPRWRQVNAYLEILSRLDNADWQPPALWALKEHPHDPDFLVEFFRLLERLAASSLVRREYTTPRQTRYINLLNELARGAGLGAPAFDITAEERADFRQRLDGEIYRVRTVDRYVLLRLDALLSPDSGVAYTHNIISIEHVLPQNPKEGSQWLVDFTEEDRAHWTHRVGNLLLLSIRKNTAAGRKDFVEKRTGYFMGKTGSTPFNLTSQVLLETEWTPAIVRARQDDLTSRLYTLWGID